MPAEVQLNSSMDLARINMYERLRDFFVPSAVLDEIFSKEKDIIILERAWKSLLQDGFSEDEAAGQIAELVYKEAEIEPDQRFEDGK